MQDRKMLSSISTLLITKGDLFSVQFFHFEGSVVKQKFLARIEFGIISLNSILTFGHTEKEFWRGFQLDRTLNSSAILPITGLASKLVYRIKHADWLKNNRTKCSTAVLRLQRNALRDVA